MREWPGSEVRQHKTGLRTMAVTGPRATMRSSHTVALPACCPVSGNPREGSTVTIAYTALGWCLEVYSIPELLTRFVGGWEGTDAYPPDRNMEGMIRLVAKMCADALDVPVVATASLVLDAGQMEVRVHAEP